MTPPYLHSKPLPTPDHSVIKLNYTHRIVKRITMDNTIRRSSSGEVQGSNGDDDRDNYINGITVNNNHYGQRRHHSSSTSSSHHYNRQERHRQQQLKQSKAESQSSESIQSKSDTYSLPFNNLERNLIDDNSQPWKYRETGLFYMNSGNV